MVGYGLVSTHQNGLGMDESRVILASNGEAANLLQSRREQKLASEAKLRSSATLGSVLEGNWCP